ncbi:hypothetical protein [Thalassoglobus polymorphus]|nr:hypothetical protein [Thalassoglobus polymorphus]
MNVTVYGSVKPCPVLIRRTQRSLKANSGGRDYFSDITLHDARNAGGMRVEFSVTATSPQGALRAGNVYLSQLCDLLTVVTRSPVWFYMPDDDSAEERIRSHRRSASVDRIMTEDEWSWITGNLVYLRRKHPRFLAASSWYRKGLLGRDVIDDFCCFWRVSERIAYSYADKSGWSDDDKQRSQVRKCVSQLRDDLFPENAPSILADETVSKIVKLRNDISHGNVPITLDIIDTASEFISPLEAVAYEILARLRDTELVTEDVA